MDLSRKLDELKERIAEKRQILVAYSGGVDSSLLAFVSTQVLGTAAFAVILKSDVLPKSELLQALALARSLELNCQVSEFFILDDEHFRQNPATRCYICKKSSAALLKSIAVAKGISCIADGVNLSDYEDYRPGIVACDEEGIWHPFVDAKIRKEDIRALARGLGLPVWNKPSSACLASRIAYGEPITRDRLHMIEEAEEFIRGLGFRQQRVRTQGGTARIELLKQDMKQAIDASDDIVKAFKAIGFNYVALDLQGYRSGSMNEVLWTRER
jgi:uncharacterized protein